MGLRAARLAATELARAFDRPDLNRLVGDGTRTNVEQDAEYLIINSLRKTYPDHQIGAGGRAAEFTWWIKAVDGSLNFTRNLPHFAVVVACLNGARTEHAIVIDPMRNEEFVASRGQGCRMSGRQLLRVSNQSKLDGALIAIPSAGSGRLNTLLREAGASTRSSGCVSLDLAWVAAGRLDGAVITEANAAAVAAGNLLTAESGGLAGDFRGGPVDPGAGAIVVGSRGIFRAALPVAAKTQSGAA